MSSARQLRSGEKAPSSVEGSRILFVYGSLMKGGKWHHLLDDQVFLGKDMVRGEMYLSEQGYYPILYASGNRLVDGELYAVEQPAFERIRKLEEGARYVCCEMRTELGVMVNVFCCTNAPETERAVRIDHFDAADAFRRWLEVTPRDSRSYEEFLQRGGRDAW